MRAAAVLVLASLALSGCLQSTVHTGRVRSVSIDAAFPPAIPIFVAAVVDDRRDPDRLGVVKNGFNLVLRDVTADDDDVAGWIHESLADSLRASGARVVDAERADAVVVRATLVEIFTEGAPGGFLFEAAGKAVIDIDVELPDGRVYRRRFGYFDKETWFDAPRDVYEERVFTAVDGVLGRIVRAVRALLVDGPSSAGADL